MSIDLESRTAQVKAPDRREDFLRAWAARDYSEARKIAEGACEDGRDLLRWRHNLAMTYCAEGMDRTARHIYAANYHLTDGPGDDVRKGNFHNSYGLVLKNLGESEAARYELGRAIYYFGRAGEVAYLYYAKNNVARLLEAEGKLSAALLLASEVIGALYEMGGEGLKEALDTLEQIKHAIEERVDRAVS